MAYHQDLVARIKRAELLSSIGVGLLGGGIGLLLVSFLGRYTVPLLLIGLIIHATGMFQKHRLENHGEAVRIWWVEALYRLCWLILGALGTYLIYSYLFR